MEVNNTIRVFFFFFGGGDNYYLILLNLNPQINSRTLLTFLLPLLRNYPGFVYRSADSGVREEDY